MIRHVTIIAGAFAVLGLLLAEGAPARSRAAPRHAPIEVNLGGYENDGDRPGIDYNLPGEATLRYFAERGIARVRLTMRWERLQPRAGGALAADARAELAAFLDRADRAGVRVIADLHNFGGRDGHKLGSAALPITALADFWSAFAQAFAGRFHGYDLMNEPHDMPNPQAWPQAAQAAVDVIRRHDRTTYIYVEGDDWSNAERWPASNASLDIRDPAHRLVYSAHVYFDRDTSGQYRRSYAADRIDPEIGVRRLQPFVDWLRKRGAKGHIGEFGVPHDDPRWLEVLDRFVGAVHRNRDVLTGAAYFAAGDWMDRYPLTLQPQRKGDRWVDRPQLKVLMKRR